MAHRKSSQKPRVVSYGAAPEPLIGQKITGVRPMTRDEAETMGWVYYPNRAPTVVVLESGAVLHPVIEEGAGRTGPAKMYGTAVTGVPFVVVTEMEAGTIIESAPVVPAGRSPRALPRVLEIGSGSRTDRRA